MKVVINTKHGGFSLSPRAVARMAELQGRPCFFFVPQKDWSLPPMPATEAEALNATLGAFSAYDIPVPPRYEKPWHEMSDRERRDFNALDERHELPTRGRDISRHGPLLVQVVEELGAAANGKFADLKVIEIPDGTDYSIEEYDGSEWVAEVHRTWR